MKKSKSKKVAKKKTTKKATNRRNPSFDVQKTRQLLNKYIDKKVLFVFTIYFSKKSMSDLFEQTKKELGILKKFGGGWRIIYGEDKDFYIFDENDQLALITVKEMYPYPIIILNKDESFEQIL